MINPKVILLSEIRDKTGWVIPTNIPAVEFVRSVPDITKEIKTKAEFIAADIVVRNWIQSFISNPCSGHLNNLGFCLKYMQPNGSTSLVSYEEINGSVKGLKAIIGNYNNRIQSELKSM